MKVLLDECLPRKLKYALPDHDCQTVPVAGFAGKKNGLLLTLGESNGFDVFLTMDKGIEYEQNLRGRMIAILVLQAKSNRLDDLPALMPACTEAVRSAQPGRVVRITSK